MATMSRDSSGDRDDHPALSAPDTGEQTFGFVIVSELIVDSPQQPPHTQPSSPPAQGYF